MLFGCNNISEALYEACYMMLPPTVQTVYYALMYDAI